MMRRLRFCYRLPFLLVLGLALAFAASGCMWGVVRDADSGKPLAGVRITITDTQGQTLTTTSDANGLFGFGAPVSASPARGPVNFQVDTPGYQTVNETRDVLYDDNPNASFENMSSFWEVQILGLFATPVPFHSDSGDFSVSLPAGWQIMENFLGVGSVTAIPPSDYLVYPADVSVGSTQLPAGTTLETWLDYTMTGVCNVTVECREVERGSAAIGGVPALWAIVSYKLTANHSPYSSGQQLQELAYFLKKGNKGYIVDLTTTADNFPGLRSRYGQIAQSFEFDS